MPTRKEAWAFLVISLPLLLAISLPYLAAARAGGEDYFFAGLLQNPVDGNSYLAKMYQGWRGDWTFTLPYTAQPGEGTYLFLFYLFLGHLARISGLSIILVFHLSRMASAAFLLLALWQFFGATFSDKWTRRLAFAMAALGSGLGWLAALAGGFTADFWVAEAYPFLGAYANPHFPLGLGLVLLLVSPAVKEGKRSRRLSCLWTWLAGLILGIVMPFGVVVAALVLAGAFALEKFSRQPDATLARAKGAILPEKPGAWPSWFRFFISWKPETAGRLVLLLAGGGPVLAYDIWVANMHPVLTGWNAQNLTLAPPLWDLLLSFSPALWLALVGGRAAWRSGELGLRLLVSWAGLGLLLLYLPFDLQRRFILGLYVPLAGLASLGIGEIAAWKGRRVAFLAGAFFLLALPTNVMILMAASQGIATHAASLYFDRGERQALEWVQANTAEEAVILAAPETSLWIPAQTGRRVVAGHPFETVEAEKMAKQIEAFFRGSSGETSAPVLTSVDYVFIGTRERALGGNLPGAQWQLVYEKGGVSIWAPIR